MSPIVYLVSGANRGIGKSALGTRVNAAADIGGGPQALGS
jgi:hypothetical protein